MTDYPNIAYLAADHELRRELTAARAPISIKGRGTLYPHREQAEIQNLDPGATVRAVIIDVPHGACFQVRLGSPAPGSYLFTHFSMAFEFAQQREPRTTPRISIFAPHETRHLGKNGKGNDVVVAIDVEHYPVPLSVTLA